MEAKRKRLSWNPTVDHHKRLSQVRQEVITQTVIPGGHHSGGYYTENYYTGDYDTAAYYTRYYSIGGYYTNGILREIVPVSVNAIGGLFGDEKSNKF